MKRILLFPAISIIYYVLNLIFILPKVEHVLAFFAVLTFMFTVFIYRFGKVDGLIEVEVDPGGIRKVSFVISGDPETMLESKDEVTFRVKRD
jgi:hypothetical protein